MEKRDLHTYFEKNNGEKTLGIVSEDNITEFSLTLRDVRERQFFPDVFLSAGSYKAVIRGVYRGSKWRDTYLGELTFLESHEAVRSLIAS